MSYVRTGGLRRGMGAVATFANGRPGMRPVIRPAPPRPIIKPVMTSILRPPKLIVTMPTPLVRSPLFTPPLKPGFLRPPVVSIGRPPLPPLSITPVLKITGIKVVTTLPPRVSPPILAVPTSILPPKALTIAQPLPRVSSPALKDVLTPADAIIQTPAGPVAVPAASSPSYENGGGGGPAPSVPAPSSFAPEPESEEAAAPAPEAPPAEAAPSGGFLSGPLPWIIGGGLALWLLTRK